MRVRAAGLLILALGGAAAAWLIAANDPAAVWRAVLAGGWGLLAVSLFKGVTLGMDAAAWACLLRPDARPSAGRLLAARWIGEAVNTLLPVAQVGGEVVRGRLLARAGVPRGEAGASVVADFTIGLAAQVVFTLLGAGLLVLHGLPEALAAPVAGGLAVIAGGALAVVAARRAGLVGLLARLPQRFAHQGKWAALAGGMADLEQALDALHQRRSALRAAFWWRLAGWIAHTGETWIALWFLGAPVGLAEALVIESLSTAVRSAAFAVPGALGAQEGGILALCLVYGIPPETGLALALVKRGREVVVSLPGLAAWAVAERRNAGAPC